MISERKVIRAVANLRSLFDSVDQMVFVLDLNGRVVTTNETARNRLRYTEEELKGRELLKLHPHERYDTAARATEGSQAAPGSRLRQGTVRRLSLISNSCREPGITGRCSSVSTGVRPGLMRP
jgi:PAS domain S-box-containing protein